MIIIKEDGTAYGCGQNTRGRMGKLPEISEMPTKMTELINIDRVSCGLWHMLALDNNGVCFSGGSNK